MIKTLLEKYPNAKVEYLWRIKSPEGTLLPGLGWSSKHFAYEEALNNLREYYPGCSLKTRITATWYE